MGPGGEGGVQGRKSWKRRRKAKVAVRTYTWFSNRISQRYSLAQCYLAVKITKNGAVIAAPAGSPDSSQKQSLADDWMAGYEVGLRLPINTRALRGKCWGQLLRPPSLLVF